MPLSSTSNKISFSALFFARTQIVPPVPLVLNAVIKGILHKRLEDQFQDRVIRYRIIDLNLEIQDITIAHLLNGEVTPASFRSLPQW